MSTFILRFSKKNRFKILDLNIYNDMYYLILDMLYKF